MTLSADDHAALERAVAKVQGTQRAGELAELIRERGWHEAAKVAAYDCQCRALRLPAWEEPPCAAGINDESRAGLLLRRMLACAVSRYDPDPLAAIAGRKIRKRTRRQPQTNRARRRLTSC
jgi:hypothetical protein